MDEVASQSIFDLNHDAMAQTLSGGEAVRISKQDARELRKSRDQMKSLP